MFSYNSDMCLLLDKNNAYRFSIRLQKLKFVQEGKGKSLKTCFNTFFGEVASTLKHKEGNFVKHAFLLVPEVFFPTFDSEIEKRKALEPA